MNKKGITLLISVLISSMAALLGLGIFMIVFGELGISGTSKASAVAFYAADSGVECALYADAFLGSFSTSSPAADINCNGDAVPLTFTADGLGGGTFKFNFTVTAGASCATVDVIKKNNGQTIINSYGENVPNCTSPTTKVIQRALEVAY